MALRSSLVWFVTVCALSWSCGGGSSNGGGSGGTGGSNTSGGTSSQAGTHSGGSSQAGSTTQTGGDTQTDGSAPTGGTESAGANQAGAAQGGADQGGAAQGGNNEGGAGGQAPEPQVFNPWALWHMPNPASAHLPNPSSYDTTTAGVVVDKVTGLIWQRDVPSSTYSWADAKSYCANLVLAGFKDWRLPSRIELVSLIDFTIANPGPTIDAAAFPNASNATFWTASARSLYTDEAWYIQFTNGFAFYDTMDVTYAARCVR
jgi:hypothetical protein